MVSFINTFGDFFIYLFFIYSLINDWLILLVVVLTKENEIHFLSVSHPDITKMVDWKLKTNTNNCVPAQARFFRSWFVLLVWQREGKQSILCRVLIFYANIETSRRKKSVTHLTVSTIINMLPSPWSWRCFDLTGNGDSEMCPSQFLPSTVLLLSVGKELRTEGLCPFAVVWEVSLLH